MEGWVGENGINGFRNGLDQRRGCCGVRKVEPFRRAVAGRGAWVTGIRRGQSASRALATPVEWDGEYGLHKVSPLLEWSENEIWDYIRKKRLPYNTLHDSGFPSIGCAPCTRAVQPGEDARAGRWWWERSDSRECGLHPRPTGMGVLQVELFSGLLRSQRPKSARRRRRRGGAAQDLAAGAHRRIDHRGCAGDRARAHVARRRRQAEARHSGIRRPTIWTVRVWSSLRPRAAR